MTSPLVIKVGGAILQCHQSLSNLFAVIKQLNDQHQPVVLVHGGGCIVDEMLGQAGFCSDKIAGLRVTAKQHMPLVSGALAGYVNKRMVALANTHQIGAVGLSLHDGQMVSCTYSDAQLGSVGVPSPQDSRLLVHLLDAQCVPIIASIGAVADGSLVNVNADDAAVVISELLAAELVLMTDVAGIRGADQQYLTSLNSHQAKALIAQGVITDGMIAKVHAAFAAANRLRRSIAVTSWRSPQSLLLLNSGGDIGTRIIPNV